MKSQTNILYIFHVSTIGGGSFCLLNIIKKLDRDKFNPIVMLRTDGPLSTELKRLKVEVIFESTLSTVPYNKNIFSIGSIIQIYYIILSIKRVIYWTKYTNADIVYLNTMMMYPYIIPLHKMRKKVIIHIRERWIKNKYIVQYNIAKIIINKYANKSIAINESCKEIVQESSNSHVIYDWIDFEDRSASFNLSAFLGNDFRSLKIFLFLGGIHNIKGSLEVFEVFSTEINDKKARLLVVGFEETPKSTTGLKRIKKSILCFFNYLSYLDKAKLVAQHDDRIVFIPPTYHVKSLIEQSFCVVSFFTMPHANLSLAESIWLGKPSIAADTPEAREYSNNGQAALLFQMNSKEDFKNKILYALDNEESIKQNALRSSPVIKNIFDPKINSSLLNSIYCDLIK